jgi:hypothetical protein
MESLGSGNSTTARWNTGSEITAHLTRGSVTPHLPLTAIQYTHSRDGWYGIFGPSPISQRLIFHPVYRLHTEIGPRHPVPHTLIESERDDGSVRISFELDSNMLYDLHRDIPLDLFPPPPFAPPLTLSFAPVKS